MRDDDDQFESLDTDRFRQIKRFKWQILLVLVVGGILLVVASLNTPAPHVPLYPEAHIVNWQGEQNSVGRQPDFRIVMETSASPAGAQTVYYSLLQGDGWGGERICQSGNPGTQSWHHDGGGLLDALGWSAHVEYNFVSEGITDIVVSVWRGSSIPSGTCGDM